MTGNSLIGNTSQFMVDETGKRVILDLSHCVCCDQTVEGVCGQCSARLPATATVDYGALTLTSSTCSAECAGFTGQYILSGGHPSCSWSYLDETFCNSGYYVVLEYRLQIRAEVTFGIGGYVQRVTTEFVFNNKRIGTGQEEPDVWVWVRRIIHEASVTTNCTSGTFPLTKVSDVVAFTPYICEGTFPTTIDLIVP